MEVRIDPLSLRTLYLPGTVQLRLWRLLEFGWPAVATLIGFERGATGSPGDQGLIAAIVVTLLLSAIGAVFSCVSATVSRSTITKEAGVIRTTYRGFNLDGVGEPEFGRIRVALRRHGDVTLRWWPLTWYGSRRPTRGIRREIVDAYRVGPSTGHPLESTVERSLIWWRIALWISIVVLCPVPYLLGMWALGR